MRPAPRLVWVTDRASCPRPLIEQAALLVRSGVEAVQLRENDLEDAELLRLAIALRQVVGELGGRLIVNDRMDLALASGADGVQLKSDGMSALRARELAAEALGEAAERFVVGRSCHGGAELAAAIDEGVDSVTLSPFAASPGKTPLGPEGFRQALAQAREAAAGRLFPTWLALGGVTPAGLLELRALAEPDERWGVAAVRALQVGVEGEGAQSVARRFAEGLGSGS